MQRNDLVGIWKLKSVKTPLEGGGVEYPFGKRPGGTIQYVKDGFMAVHLTGSDEADGKTRAYSGRWSFENDIVTHHVEVSLEPELRGVTLQRRAELNGNTLIYRTVEAQGPGRPEVIWEKVP